MPDENDMTTRLILADGTVLNKCECGYSEKNLWCFLDKETVSFLEACQYFSDLDCYNMIIFELGFSDYTDVITYSNIEDCIAIQKTEKTIDVRLIGNDIKIEQKRIFKDGE